MQLALRPYVTAGVAVVGAGLISATPVVAPDLEEQVTQRAVALASAASDAVDMTANATALALKTYPMYGPLQLLENTFANVSGLTQEFLDKPFPILTQVVSNQMGYAQTMGTALQDTIKQLVTTLDKLPATLQTAWTDIMSGDFFGGVATLNTYFVEQLPLAVLGIPILEGVVPIVKDMVGNLNNVFQNADAWLLEALLAPIYPLNAANLTIGAVGQNIVDAMDAGNVGLALQDVLLAPSTIVNGMLNGAPGYGATSALLTNPLSTYNPESFGTFQNLFRAADAVAKLITPAATVAKAAAAVVDPSVSANLSAAAADISAMLNPAVLSADLSAALNPADLAAAFGSALTSIGDIPSMLMSLVP